MCKGNAIDSKGMIHDKKNWHVYEKFIQSRGEDSVADFSRSLHKRLGQLINTVYRSYDDSCNYKKPTHGDDILIVRKIPRIIVKSPDCLIT